MFSQHNVRFQKKKVHPIHPSLCASSEHDINRSAFGAKTCTSIKKQTKIKKNQAASSYHQYFRMHENSLEISPDQQRAILSIPIVAEPTQPARNLRHRACMYSALLCRWLVVYRNRARHCVARCSGAYRQYVPPAGFQRARARSSRALSRSLSLSRYSSITIATANNNFVFRIKQVSTFRSLGLHSFWIANDAGNSRATFEWVELFFFYMCDVGDRITRSFCQFAGVFFSMRFSVGLKGFLSGGTISLTENIRDRSID